jgi:hypothetical protein
MKLGLVYCHPKYSDSVLNESVQSILEANQLMAMATLRDSEAYANAAYFAFDNRLNIFVLCEPTTQHGQNLARNPFVAGVIYDSHQPWTSDKRGLQVFGPCEVASGSALGEAVACYLRRFGGPRRWITGANEMIRRSISSKFYVMRVRSLKLLDEPRFGKKEFISLCPQSQKSPSTGTTESVRHSVGG